MMKGISIKGKKLHEIRMLMVPYTPKSVSYLSYPKSRIHVQRHEHEITLSLPPMLALELYRQGIIPQNEQESFPIEISGKKVGVFTIVDFRYPNSYSDDSVTITLQKQ